MDGRIRNIGDAGSSDTYTVSTYVDDWWVDGWLHRMTGFQQTMSPKIAPGRTQVWHFTVSDYAVFKHGSHQIRAIVSEQNDPNPDNNELTMTLKISPGYYNSDFNIVNYGMCSRIDDDRLPVGMTENFGSDEELAISYFYTDINHADWPEKIGLETNLTFRFYNPSGTMQRESRDGYSILLARDPSGRQITGFAFELLISKDPQRKEGDVMYNPGYQALGNLPGTWRVQVLNKEHVLFTKKFIIEGKSSHIASSSAASNNQSPTENLGTVVPGGYPTIVGTIAVVVVGGGIVLSRRRKRQPSVRHLLLA